MRDADAEADGGQPDGDDVDAGDGTDLSLDDADRPDAEADIPEEAEGWDFGADLWDPQRNCDAAVEDPPAWLAPPCGDGCRQVAFTAQPRGPFAASERWLVYQGLHRTRYVDLSTGEESVLFCHPEFMGSHAVAVDADTVVFALSTELASGATDIAYAAAWSTGLPLAEHKRIAEWTRRLDVGRTWLTDLAISGQSAVLTKYDVQGSLPGTWVQRADVFAINVGTLELERITDLGWPCCLGWPDIGGDWVVYSTTSAVLAYNLETRTTIGPDIPGDQYWPRTDGVNVIWLDHRNYAGGYMSGGSWDIYSYNFETETELRITTESTPVAEDAAPDMLGDVVVWSDRRNATLEEPHHRDLFLYRYSTGREQQLTFASGAARWPRVTDNGVYFVWVPDPEPDPDTADRAICEQLLPPP